MRNNFKKAFMALFIVVIITALFAPKAQAASGVILTTSDIDRLERLVYSEAGNQTLECQKLVCTVIINRVAHADFPNTVEEVIRQKNPVNGVYQFSVVPNGMYDNAGDKVTPQVRQAVAEVLSDMQTGKNTVPSNVLFFNSIGFFDWATVCDFKQVDDMYFSCLK